MSYYDVDRRVAGLIPGRNLNVTGSAPAGPGEKTASEYIISGIPFVTGSSATDDNGNAYEVKFPMMSSWFQVQNGASEIKVGFTAEGIAAQQFFIVPQNTVSSVFYIRTKSVFIDSGGSGYSIIAGLTGIPTGSIQDLENSTYWGV